MKKLVSIFLAAAMLLTAFPLSAVFAAEEIDKWDGITVAAEFDGGSGTENDPYIISTGAQLALLRNIVNESDAKYDELYKTAYGERAEGAVVSGNNLTHKRLSGKYFKLVNDIDMSGKNMGKGIGNSTGNSQTFTFAGNFDGGGHIIRNYYTSYAWDLRAMGLFGITEDATVANLGMENAKISVANKSTAFGYAVLIGKAYGSLNLSNCYVRNSTVEVSGSVGADTDMGLGILTGAIGYDKSSGSTHNINNCYAVNNTMNYSGETVARLFKKAAVFGKTAAYGIDVNNCYASGLTFTNITTSAYSDRTNNMFTPSANGSTKFSSKGSNCFVEGEQSTASVDYLKPGDAFTAVTADELKALPNGLNSKGAYETKYAGLINNGYPVLVWESEKYAPTAILYETAKGIIDNFDFAMISDEDKAAVTQNLNLFTEAEGLNCVWQSSRNASVTAGGIVTRDFVDRPVELTLSIHFPDGTQYPEKKVINIVVLKNDSTPEELVMKFDRWDGTVAENFDGGDGTAGNPYQIATGAQLALLKNIVNATDSTYRANYEAVYGERPDGEHHTFAGKYFILTADLDMDNRNFGEPIGKYTDVANTFYFDGNFDGDGHVIKNFVLTTNERNSGLFGYINNSTIKNVGLENPKVTLTATTTSGSYGILVAMARSGNTISECFVKNGSITMTNKLTGTVSTRLGAICASIGVSGSPTAIDKTTTVQNCYVDGLSIDYTFGNNAVFDCASSIGYVGNHKVSVSDCYAANVTFGDSMSFPTITKNMGMMFRPNLGSGTSTIENCYAQTADSETGAYTFAMGTVWKVSADTLCGLPAALNSDAAFTTEYAAEVNGGMPMLVWEKYAYELIEYMVYNQFDFSKISGEPQNAVSENLNLITDLGYGVSGRWSSDNKAVVGDDGTVQRRSYEQEVNLTMEILFRGDTVFPRKISYKVTVLRLDGYSDEDILKEYLDTVMTSEYFTEQPTDEITKNLKNGFPTEGPDGISLSWENSDETHIAPDGTVTRPNWNDGNAAVTLKLIAVKGAATAQKIFAFTVLCHISPEAALNNAMNTVTYEKMTSENPSAITKRISLPSDFDDYVSVVWNSSNEEVIASDGTVIRQMRDTTVTVTATFTHELSGESASKDFTFTVLISPAGKMAVDSSKLVFDDMNRTVSDFELALIGPAYQSTITWATSDAGVISIRQYAGAAQACVKRPEFESGNKTVTLTASMENEGQKGSFTFEFEVLCLPSDSDVVQLAFDSITYETISAESPSEIRNNLSLVKNFSTGVQCVWETSDETTVNTDGKIFPSLNEDKTVTLTAAVRKGAVSKTKSFEFTVKGLTEEELLEKAYEYLTFDTLTSESINEVCSDFALPQNGDFGTKITWKSGNTDLLEIVGESGQLTAKIKRPSFAENGKMAVLSAVIALGGRTMTKEFFITIKAQTAFSQVFLLNFEDDSAGSEPANPSTGTLAKTNASVSAVVADDPSGAVNKVLMLSNGSANTEGIRYTNGFDDKATTDGIVYAKMNMLVPSETQGVRIRLYNFSEVVMADVTIEPNGQVVVDVFDEGYREIFLRSRENLFPLDIWNELLMVCDTDSGKLDLFLNGDCISDYGELTVNGDVYFEGGIPFKSAPMTLAKYFPLRKVRIDAREGTVYADNIGFSKLLSRYTESLYKAMENIDMNFRIQNNIEALCEDLKLPSAPTGFTMRTYSSNNDVLSDSGKVREVIDADGYAEFTIELGYLAEKVRKTYPVRVPETIYTDEERARKDMDAVYRDITSRYDFSNIRENISFAASGKYGSEIFLVSGNSAVISNDGIIKQGAADEKVTLTLTAKRNGAVVEKTFVVTVKAKETPKNISGGGGSAAAVSFGKNAAQNIFNRPEKPVSFRDVSTSHWAYAAIMSLAEKGVVSGGTDNNFNPDSSIKREEFLKMLLLAFNIEIGDYKNDFADVDKTAWYRLYVSTARYNQITRGDENGNFGAGSEITRQDAAVMLCRVCGLQENNGAAAFDDDAQISDYAKKAVYSLRDKGVMKGKENNKFAPTDAITRAEAAALLYRLSDGL